MGGGPKDTWEAEAWANRQGDDDRLDLGTFGAYRLILRQP